MKADFTLENTLELERAIVSVVCETKGPVNLLSVYVNHVNVQTKLQLKEKRFIGVVPNFA